ncbi:MAG TPA: hypothetical protein ENJ13_10330 [Chromatiales bacterium]|nr:hypothetical protein [Chromatiales bacterium]
MPDHASELRRRGEDSTTESSSAHRSSEQEAAADQTSIPAYLGGEPQREQATLNLSLASQQTAEADERLSQEMESMSLDGRANSEAPTSSLSSETSDTITDGSEAASVTEAASENETETESESEAETEEDSESAGDEENAETEADSRAGAGEQAEEDAEEETETQEEQEASREGEGEVSRSGDVAAQGQQRRTGEYAKKGRDEIVAIMPKLTPIRTPYVPSPPKAALIRRDEILKRTGSPPEYHHALVRQSAQRTAQAARDAQRRMLFNIGNLGMNTRISIEEMAVEVQGVTAAAVKQINDAVDQSMRDIDLSLAKEQAHITEQNIKTGEELQASRDRIMLEITANLMEGSEEIRQAAEIAEARFNEKIPQAAGYINDIPTSGIAAQLPQPPNPQSTAGGGNQNSEQPAGGGESGAAAQSGNQESTPSYRVMSKAEKRLTHFMDIQSGIISEKSSNVKTYLLSRASPVLEGMAGQEQTRLVTNAGEHATRLSSDANKAQFTTLVLSLTTPVSQHHEQDESQSVDEVSNKSDQQLTETEAAVRSARRIIQNKGKLAKEYADLDMRNTLTKNIRKSGNKTAQGLRSQASSAETALNNSAAQMAEAYRDLVRRLDALLPAEQFLDSRNLLPKLIVARDSAFKLQQQHEKAAQQQADMTLEKMDKIKRDQINSISKAGRDSVNSMEDVVTRTSFDMSMFSSQMTGEMSAGAIQGITAAQEYATRMAEGIIESRDKLDDEGLQQVDAIAVGFLNGAISAAAQSQYGALENFVKEMEKVGDKGSLTKPMMDSRADLERRASAIDNAMPGQSLATAGGLALLSPIAAGVYLYCSDGDENVVIEKLGNLMWPGVLGLEDVFNTIYPSPSLLRPRIRSELGSPEKWHALNLLSTSARVRGYARMSIANYSTGWFDYNRAARESALQGLSQAERDAVAAFNPRLIETTRTNLISGLNEHQGAIATAYLDRNRERAVAARTRESLDKARGQGEWGWIFSAQSAQRRSDEARVTVMANMRGVLQQELAVESAYLPREVIDRSTQRVQSEFASLTDPRRRAASAFSPEDAQAAMTRYATSPHLSAIQGWGSARIERVEMSDDASQYIRDLVRYGPESNEARASRGVFEFRRAQGDSTLGIFDDLSETSQTRLSDAFENRQLATLERQVREARNPRERSRYQRLLDEERGKHRVRMQMMARRLGAPKEIANDPDPAAAERWMADQVGGLFAREDDYVGNRPSHARYGQEMITSGRASLVASVQLATEGAGTHEALLRRAYGDRSRAEIDAANAQWAVENGGENMEEMLGIQRRSWGASDYGLMALSPLAWFATRSPEVSGDLAFELERLSRGNRETDLDHVQYAGLHYNQERVRGAGFLARSSMRGTPEQQNLDGRRDRLAQTILDAARAEAARQGNPDAIAAYERNPGAIFNPDGSIDPVVQALAFSTDGSFLGNTSQLQHYTQSVSLAAESYRNEIDRQEKMLTTGITVLALVASVALMLIPGVNIVAAGIITAVIAGAATIAVKAGMRGERYGWEEAATDVATTAIEAATAGFGGALGGGLGKSGALAGIGEALKGSLGSIGSAVAREAFVSAISSGAQIALQDEVWQDGLDRGLERVLNGAVKGAAVAAVTAGVSEGLTSKLGRSMSPGDLGPSDFSRMQKLGSALGPNGSEIFQESIAELFGSAVGETAGVITDYATGKFEGKFGDALKQIGQAGLRDMVSGTLRAGATSQNKARYRQLLDVARSGEPMSPSDQRALRLAAISAGVMNYDDGPEKIRAEIDAGRELLVRLPQGLREQASSYDLNTLRNIVSMIDAGDLGSQGDRSKFLRDLNDSVPDLDGRALMREMEAAIASLHPADEADAPDTAQQARIRQQLAAGMDPELRNVMDDVRIEGMEYLTEADLRRASEMIARGEFDSATADALFRQARLEKPELSEFAFLRSLADATATSHQAQALKKIQTQQRHSEVMAALSPDGRKVFAGLPAESLKQIKKLLDRESMGTAHEQEALFREAQQRNPELTRAQFDGMLASAVAKVKTEHAVARDQARHKRQQQMSNVPEHLRGTLSVLPEASLVDLHLRQMEGTISPGERVRLEEAALRENPDLDLDTFCRAIDEAVQQGAPIRPTDDESAQMRREMLAAVPAEQRAQLSDVPILVMRPGDFEAFTRSSSGNAVTLILQGEPVIVMREGASPRVLREEGIHALQSKDPRWSERLGALRESDLQRWDELPLAQQMALYRNKIDIEIDAHDRMIDGLAEQLRRSSDPAEQAQLRSELALAQATLSNLQRRHAEVASIGPMQRLQIEAGLLARPQWLDQPARLFSKGEPATGPPPVQKTREELLAEMVSDLTPGGTQATATRKLIDSIDVEQLNRLASLELSPADMRKVLRSHDTAEGVAGMIDQLNQVADVLPADQRTQRLGELVARRDFTELISLLGVTVRSAPDVTSAAQFVAAVLTLRGHHLDVATGINQLLERAGAEQASDFARLMDSIGSEGRQSLINLMGEMRSTFDALKLDNSDSFAAIAGLIRIASSGDVDQRVDLFNRTHNLLSALAELPSSAAHRKVVNHIVDGLISGKDSLAHALDIRAASRLLEKSKSAADALERFTASLSEGGSLTGGDAFQLHLRDKLKEWPDFREKYSDFATMLKDVTKDTLRTATDEMREKQTAALADLEPWFTYITGTDWFSARVKESGRNHGDEARYLLGDIIKSGLRRGTGVNSLDTLRHIMQEMRQKIVEVDGRPKFNEEVKREMARLGFSEEAIAQREKDFDSILAENRAAMGRETPEVHLENLVRQRIEYQRMIDAAEQLAHARYPSDAAARKALINEMTSGLRQKVTETVGEIAATRAMNSDERFKGFYLHSGFEQGIGFDQVWVRFGPDGKVSEIMIVEAKGPGATTQKTRTKGAQMSAEWVARTAAQMIMRGDDTGIGTMIIDALQNGHPPVAGVVIQAKDRSGTAGDISAATGADKSNFRYDLNDLNRHSVIKTTTTDLAQDIQGQISSLDKAHYRLQYDQAETIDLITHARRLKLSDNEIADLLIEGSRISHPIEAKNLKTLMESVASIIVDSTTTGLFRREANTGIYTELKVPMQKRFVLRAALEGGIGLEGLKVRIVRDPELLGKNIFGYTHPNGMIDLYPDAFTNLEDLIKTLGHERTHVMQIEIFGHPNTYGDRMIEQLNLNEIAAHGIEESFWKYYLQNRSGRLMRFE